MGGIEAWPRLQAGEILAKDAGQVKWLIEPLIPRGALVILAAGFKTGKSWFVYKLALDAALGRSSFGRLAMPLDVAVFQGEMPRHEDVRRWRRLAQGAGVLDQLPRLLNSKLHLYSRPTGLDLNTHVREFENATRDAQLVIVDSMLAAFPGLSINENEAIRAKFSSAFYSLTNRGVSVILLHHVRKSPSGQNRKADEVVDASDILGAQSICAAADVIYALTRAGEGVLKLTNIGSWVPAGSSEEKLIKVMDSGEGTIVVPIQPIGAR